MQYVEHDDPQKRLNNKNSIKKPAVEKKRVSIVRRGDSSQAWSFAAEEFCRMYPTTLERTLERIPCRFPVYYPASLISTLNLKLGFALLVVVRSLQI